jgi:hypothetical protein
MGAVAGWTAGAPHTAPARMVSASIGSVVTATPCLHLQGEEEARLAWPTPLYENGDMADVQDLFICKCK